jgi:hypothetical protein
MKKISCFFFLIIASPHILKSQCYNHNAAFKIGEKIEYEIVYSWGPVWVPAGKVDFEVSGSKYKDRPVYYFHSFGTSYKSYDWFYKVRDYFESYVDTSTLQTLWASRKSYEGGNEVFEDYTFNHNAKKLYATVQTSAIHKRSDTLNLATCLNDLNSAIYYARNIDFSKCKINDKVPFWVIIIDKTYPLYIRYLGKEVFTTRDNHKYNCIKFSSKLVEGTIFKGGEDLKVWVTDDENHIALQVEAKILVGSIKAVLKNAENLMTPLSSSEIK